MRNIELTFVNTREGILQEIKKVFPSGKIDEKGFSVNNNAEQLSYTIIDFLGAFHVALFEGSLAEDTHIHIKPNDVKSLVIRFILESSVKYKENEVSIGEGLENGASLFNTFTAQNIVLQKGKKIKWLAVHIPLDKWMDFTQSKWEALNEMIQNEKPWALFESMTPKYANLIKDIFAYNELDLGRKGLTISKTIELVTHFLMQLQKRSLDKESLGIPDVDLSKLMAIKELLAKNLEEPPSMEFLASTFAMSESKLRSNFKKMYGVPPYKYVVRERLNESYRLLESTDRSLTDIALSLGFNDQSHFNKAFKNAFDCIPSSIRG